MTATTLDRDGFTIALLCTRLALADDGSKSIKPLSVSEWSPLAQRVAASDWKRPGALLGRTAAEIRAVLDLDERSAERIATLLDRSGQLAIELERLAGRGIRVLTRADEAYPAKLKLRLRGQAPAVLFYSGEARLLSRTGVAVVGSRDVDESGSGFAARFAEWCAEEGLTVFSGAARGVDRLAMMASADRSGTSVGVLADSLDRVLRERDIGANIRAGHLTLVTPFHPSAGFNVGNAMGRNKVIYCLSDYAMVIASSLENGGTRAGALENLRAGWVPLFVRAGAGAPPGNHDLIDRGGIPLASELLSQPTDLLTYLKTMGERARAGHPDASSSAAGVAFPSQDRLRQAISPGERERPGARAGEAPIDSEPLSPMSAGPDGEATSVDLFGAVWQYLEPFLVEPRTEKEMAAFFDLEVSQARAWLARAVASGLAERTKRPVRYRAVRRNGAAAEQGRLFDAPYHIGQDG